MTTIFARLRASSTRSSTTTNGWTATSRKRAPWRLITAIGVPPAASATASPVPGPRRLAGRITRAFWARTGTRSRCLQTWFPSVITSAPEARSFSASLAVSPVPSAAFSPLTMQKPAPSSSLRPVSRASMARRPGGPNTSPMKRILSAALLRLGRREPAGCAHLDVDVLALVLRDSCERGSLGLREVDDASDLRAASRDGRPHRQRWIGLEVLELHDHARASGRLDVDAHAVGFAVHDHVGDRHHASVHGRIHIGVHGRPDVEAARLSPDPASELVEADARAAVAEQPVEEPLHEPRVRLRSHRLQGKDVRAGSVVADRRDPRLVDRHLNPQRVLKG